MRPPVLLAAGLWQVRFEWQHDRYAHRLFAWDAGALREILVSVEGNGDGGAALAERPSACRENGDYPVSPPWQNLHCEHRKSGGDVALLLGMAGRSHWSMSVGSTPEGGCLFDVACRVAGPLETIGPLGSTYQTAPDVQLESDAATGVTAVRLPLGTAVYELRCQSPSCAEVHLEQPVPKQLRIVASPQLEEHRPTVRWQYVLKKCPPPGE